jgi:hypothetical protein
MNERAFSRRYLSATWIAIVVEFLVVGTEWVAPIRTAVKELARSTLRRSGALPQAVLPPAMRPLAIRTEDLALFSTEPARWTTPLRSRDAQAQGS